MSKSNAERTREFRKRKKENQDREEFNKFLSTTQFSLLATEEDKLREFEKFKKQLELEKKRDREERKRRKRLERNRRYKAKLKLKLELKRVGGEDTLTEEDSVESEEELELKKFVSHRLAAEMEFRKRLGENDLGTMSASPANGGFRGNSSPGFHSTHGFTSSPIFPNYHQSNVHNGPTDLSMKSVKPILSHKLNPTEIAAVRQLITGYRESAAFLLRSADELEQLLIQQQ